MAERREDLWSSLKEAGRRASDFLFRGRLTGVLLLVLIVALTGVVVHLVKARLLRSAHFRVDPSTVRFGDLPAWAPERIASELRQRCRGLPARPILDPLLDVADAVEILVEFGPVGNPEFFPQGACPPKHDVEQIALERVGRRAGGACFGVRFLKEPF